jgi:hypothetical protein
MATTSRSLGRSLLPPLVTFGAVASVGLFVIDLVVAGTAHKTGNCFAIGSFGDRWISGIGHVSPYVVVTTVVLALAGAIVAEGRRQFCFWMGVLAAGAGVMCFLYALGNAICEY